MSVKDTISKYKKNKLNYDKTKLFWEKTEEILAKMSADEKREYLSYLLSQTKRFMKTHVIMGWFLFIFGTFVLFSGGASLFGSESITWKNISFSIFPFTLILMFLICGISYIHDGRKGLKIINKVKAINLSNGSELHRGFDIMLSNFLGNDGGKYGSLSICYNGKDSWRKYAFLSVLPLLISFLLIVIIG